MSSVRLSVLVATYNQASYLGQALDSLKAQSLPSTDFEVIVINDGSTDHTASVVSRYAGLRTVSRPNRGLVASCNEGLEMARGAYFTRLDSDDFAAPEWLATLLPVIEGAPDVVCVSCDRYELSDSGQRYAAVQANNLYSLEACGTLFRTEALRKVGGYRPFYWEEYDLYLRLRSEGRFDHVAKPLYTYRKHGAAMTASPDRRLQGWQELAKEWGKETLRSVGTHADLVKL